MITSEFDPSVLWTDHSITLEGFAGADGSVTTTHCLTERLHV
jgi:hypothetical protein